METQKTVHLGFNAFLWLPFFDASVINGNNEEFLSGNGRRRIVFVWNFLPFLFFIGEILFHRMNMRHSKVVKIKKKKQILC